MRTLFLIAAFLFFTSCGLKKNNDNPTGSITVYAIEPGEGSTLPNLGETSKFRFYYNWSTKDLASGKTVKVDAVFTAVKDDKTEKALKWEIDSQTTDHGTMDNSLNMPYWTTEHFPVKPRKIQLVLCWQKNISEDGSDECLKLAESKSFEYK